MSRPLTPTDLRWAWEDAQAEVERLNAKVTRLEKDLRPLALVTAGPRPQTAVLEDAADRLLLEADLADTHAELEGAERAERQAWLACTAPAGMPLAA